MADINTWFANLPKSEQIMWACNHLLDAKRERLLSFKEDSETCAMRAMGRDSTETMPYYVGRREAREIFGSQNALLIESEHDLGRRRAFYNLILRLAMEAA